MINSKKIISIICAATMVVSMTAGIPAGVDAAKKPKLSKSKVSIKIGKSVIIKLKNGNKKAKVTWKSAKPKIAKITKKVTKGSNASAKIKGIKAGKSKLTATYKLGKKTTKLSCNVTVSKNKTIVTSSPAPTIAATIPAVVTPVITGTPVIVTTATPVPTATPEPFNIINNSAASAMMYIDANESEYDGISLITEAFKADIARVAGIGTDKEGVANESDKGLNVTTDKSQLSGRAIIAGTFGENGNDVINSLISEGKLDVSGVEGKWESYKLQVVKNPMAGVSEALVIAGSDKRGTIYGIFHVSELMGVSPWVWWADSTPAVCSKVDLNGVDVNMTSKEPSVKYRGIFLNDESPSLTNWTNSRYGGRNELFYNQVYELILRLKGDYLWPAMWGDAFSKGGKSSQIANAEMADKYGVVMGTSHHEPLYRAGNEWGSEYSKYKGALTDNAANVWNKYNLPSEQEYDQRVNTAIEKFWNDGVARNGNFDNICTVGMRGENDSSLPAADDPKKYAQLLNYIITQQKNILADNGDINPTQLVIYKEVENAWNEGELYDQECMSDTIAMLADDNWAYVRTLPTYEQQQKVGGLGMYYHFDYVGAPKSYTWVQTTQLSRVWDQMSVSYDYGIDDVWIVNVGDLKPMEMDISYFIDLGYDYDKWGVNGNDKLAEYKAQWTAKQFAQTSDGSGLNEAQLKEASQLIDDYLDLETSRKVEHVLSNTVSNCSDMFSIDNYNEAIEVLMKCNDIMERAEALKKQVPDDLQAAFYQLVYYPAMAVPNVLKIQIYAALNVKYAAMNLTVANKYAELCNEAIALDNELYNTFNNAMPGAPEDGKKWKGMQSADQKYHIGMTVWNTDSGKLPTLKTVSAGTSGLNVLVQGVTDSLTSAYSSGSATLPAFTSTGKEAYTIELANKGSDSYNYTASTSADWIVLSKSSGTVAAMDTIEVSIDWSKVTANVAGTVTISDGTSNVIVNVSANVISTEGLAANTYVMANDYAAINVANYSAIKTDGSGTTNAGKKSNNAMIVVPDNGKYLTSIRTSSSTITYNNASDLSTAPYVEYKVYVPEAGTYNLQCQFNPTSNLEYNNMQLRYGISVDGGEAKITNSIVDNYLAGTWQQGTWATDIEKNGRSSTLNDIALSAGVHTIRYYQCDPNMALIRMTVYSGELATVYNSPAESYYVGKNADTSAVMANKNKMYSAIK